jgi:hypothetical protein
VVRRLATLLELRKALDEQLDARAAASLEEFIKQSALLQEWLPFLYGCFGTRCSPLLASFQAAIVEAAGYTALGLGSAAMSAQRKSIELLYNWLYFLDQPLMWNRAVEDGTGFLSRDEIVKFLGKNYPMYTDRWQALEGARTRTVQQPYGFLSKHIHSQSVGLLGSGPNLAGLVSEPNIIQDVNLLQGCVAEFLSDLLAARFMGSWPLLPDKVQANLAKRLGKNLADLTEVART